MPDAYVVVTLLPRSDYEHFDYGLYSLILQNLKSEASLEQK